jgi:hypothetical protein
LDSQTGIAVVNLSSRGIQLNFRAYDDTGRLITGINVANPAVKLLTPGSQMADVLSEIFGGGFNMFSGWVELTSPGSNIAGFFLEFDPRLNRMLGADAVSKGETYSISPQISGAGLDLANLSSDVARISLQARNNQGQAIARTDVLMAGKGHFSSGFESILPLMGYTGPGRVDIITDKPVSAFITSGLNLVTGGRQTGYNAIALSSGAQVLYAPQYVVGGGYQSRFFLVNLESRAVQVTLRWISDAGTVLGTPLQTTLPPQGTTHLEGSQPFGLSPGSGSLEGYLEVRSNSGKIAGVVNFSDMYGQLFAASLQAVTAGQKRVLYAQLADDDLYFTGVAVLNSGATSAKVTIKALTPDGQEMGAADLTLSPGTRSSMLLSEAIPNLPKVSEGYFILESDVPVASFAVFGTRDLRVLAAIPPRLF